MGFSAYFLLFPFILHFYFAPSLIGGPFLFSKPPYQARPRVSR